MTIHWLNNFKFIKFCGGCQDRGLARAFPRSFHRVFRSSLKLLSFCGRLVNGIKADSLCIIIIIISRSGHGLMRASVRAVRGYVCKCIVPSCLLSEMSPVFSFSYFHYLPFVFMTAADPLFQRRHSTVPNYLIVKRNRTNHKNDEINIIQSSSGIQTEYERLTKQKAKNVCLSVCLCVYCILFTCVCVCCVCEAFCLLPLPLALGFAHKYTQIRSQLYPSSGNEHVVCLFLTLCTGVVGLVPTQISTTCTHVCSSSLFTRNYCLCIPWQRRRRRRRRWYSRSGYYNITSPNILSTTESL